MRRGDLIQFCAGRYYQGEGVLHALAEDALRLGKRALIITDCVVWPKIENIITACLTEKKIEHHIWYFNGEASPANFAKAVEEGRNFAAELIIAAGGGKVIDSGKIVADKLQLRCLTVPTSAATCAASAWLAVEYTDSGAFVGNYWSEYNPFAVFADLSLIVKNCPLRLNVAGIVDAMAKYPEIYYNIHYSDNWEKNVFSHSAALLAENNYHFFISEQEEIIKSLSEKRITPVLEDAVAGALQLTGLISAMACGGKQAAVSHTLYSYFCTEKNELTKRFLHGELVGSSLIYQLAVNGAEEAQINELNRFLRRLNMPTCLQDLGIEESEAEVESLFAFLRQKMPIEQASEWQRLKAKQNILFRGV